MPTAETGAAAWLARGFAPIPVPYGAKAPVVQGWQKLRLTAGTLDEQFNGAPLNVGALLGEPSGGRVCVDLDAPEALALAGRCLPRTGLICGRPGNPASHRFYAIEGTVPTTRRYDDPLARGGQDTKARLCELLSTGAQVIVEGQHPSGECYRVEADGAPATVDANVLMAQLGKLAAAALLARYWPGEGSRHEAALALAGGLCRAGWSDADAGTFVRDVADVAGDDQTADRLRAAEDTASRLEDGEHATGWPRLSEIIDERVVARARDWLGISAGSKSTNARPPSQATQLVGLAAQAELFHAPDGEAFATIPVGEHFETVLLRTKPFRRWLARLYYLRERTTPGSQALQDALAVLEGNALFDGAEYPVSTRLAEHAGAIYLDLGDAAWRAVEVTAAGWGIIPRPPVKFRRARGLLALPAPERGGSLADLRPFLNVASEDDYYLLVGWLVQALRPRGPYPIGIVQGGQGSAKSTTTRLLRDLVDPYAAPLRAEPKDPRDLMIAATNSWVIALDNLSRVPDWLSDALCRLATGGGFSTRELYSDAEEIIFDAQRPVLLNGIEELASRGDLVDRALPVDLPDIDDEARRTEAEFWHSFAGARPRILGALLDGVAGALAGVDTTHLDALPRMADFAAWVAAAAPALGWHHQAFLDAYTGNRLAANELPLDASLVVPVLRQVVPPGAEWEGTAAALLAALNTQVDEAARALKGWPKTARGLSGQLRRLRPNLHGAGVKLTLWPPIRGSEFKSFTRWVKIYSGIHGLGMAPLGRPPGPDAYCSAPFANGPNRPTGNQNREGRYRPNRPYRPRG